MTHDPTVWRTSGLPGDEEPYPNARDCEHGNLRRSCGTCERDDRIAELERFVREVAAVGYEAVDVDDLVDLHERAQDLIGHG